MTTRAISPVTTAPAWQLAVAGAMAAVLVGSAGAALLLAPAAGGIAFAAAAVLLGAAILAATVRGSLLLPMRRLREELARLSGAAAAAAAQAAMHRMVAENTTDLIVLGDAERRRIYVSPSYTDVLGYTPEELIGGHGLELVHPDDLGRVSKVFIRIGPGYPLAELVFRMRRKDGEYVWIESRNRYLPESGGILAVLRDITSRRQVEDLLAEAYERLETANLRLEAQARQDGLTGLGNRRHFDEMLEKEFRRARRLELPLGLVLLDVDCFKAYNDRYGHVAGDACLRRICEAVRGSLQRPGDEASRYGGEEIVVLLPATDQAGALEMATRFLDVVRSLRIEHLGSCHGIVTISAGSSAIMPFDATDDPTILVHAADRALYQAKAGGRDLALSFTPALPDPALSLE